MEEKILEIIKLNIPDCRIYVESGSRAKDAAKEITAHVFEFIEWIGIMSDQIWWNQRLEKWMWTEIIDTESENISQYYTSELYDYWYKEVWNKNLKQ